MPADRARDAAASRARTDSVAGVVLAAGASTRFGRNKLLLTLDGESLARRAASAALAAGLEPVVVVLGHDAERVREELTGLPVRAVVNADHSRGMSTSLAAGIAALPAETAAAVVHLADMPLVTAAMISVSSPSSARRARRSSRRTTAESRPRPPCTLGRCFRSSAQRRATAAGNRSCGGMRARRSASPGRRPRSRTSTARKTGSGCPSRRLDRYQI